MHITQLNKNIRHLEEAFHFWGNNNQDLCQVAFSVIECWCNGLCFKDHRLGVTFKDMMVHVHLCWVCVAVGLWWSLHGVRHGAARMWLDSVWNRKHTGSFSFLLVLCVTSSNIHQNGRGLTGLLTGNCLPTVYTLCFFAQHFDWEKIMHRGESRKLTGVVRNVGHGNVIYFNGNEKTYEKWSKTHLKDGFMVR